MRSLFDPGSARIVLRFDESTDGSRKAEFEASETKTRSVFNTEACAGIMRSVLCIVILMGSVNIAAAQWQRDSLFVLTHTDTVSIWDVRVEENCASRFRSTITVSHDTVTWIQTDTVGHLDNCLCRYDLRASVTGLSSGSYLALVYREQLRRYRYERDTLILIGTVAFAVLTSGGTLSSTSYQSGCKSLSVPAEDDPLLPTAYTLESFPNPFNPATTISYTLAASSHVLLEVYNVIGQRIAVLTDQERGAGTHSVQWRPDAASGIYHCRLQAISLSGTGIVVRSRKLVLMQ